jgi:hypothetical protein
MACHITIRLQTVPTGEETDSDAEEQPAPIAPATCKRCMRTSEGAELRAVWSREMVTVHRLQRDPNTFRDALHMVCQVKCSCQPYIITYQFHFSHSFAP